jgi:hypothetical protein
MRHFTVQLACSTPDKATMSWAQSPKRWQTVGSSLYNADSRRNGGLGQCAATPA